MKMQKLPSSGQECALVVQVLRILLLLQKKLEVTTEENGAEKLTER